MLTCTTCCACCTLHRQSTCSVSFDGPEQNCVLPNWDHTCDITSGTSGSSMWDTAARVRAIVVAEYNSREMNLATPLRPEVRGGRRCVGYHVDVG